MARTILLILFFLSLSAPSFSADDVYVAQTGPDGVQRVELTAGSYFFRPEHIVVSVGVPVELVIRNESKIVPHNFVMDSPEAGMALSEALSEKLSVVRFTPSKTGRYPFYCDRKLLFLKSHRERGMEGVIDVR